MIKRTIGTYIARQTLPWLLLGLAGSSFVFLVTQLVRIAPVFTGSGITFASLLKACLLLLVPVAGWALTPAFLIAVFAVAGAMAENGELVAMDALAVPKGFRVRPAIGVTLLLAILSGWIWLDGAPRAGGQLLAMAREAAGNALIGRLTSGRIEHPFPGLTFYAEQAAGGGRFATVFAEWAPEEGPTQQIVAKKAFVTRTADGKHLRMRFEKGHLFFVPEKKTAETPSTAVTFGAFDVRFSIDDLLTKRLDFIPEHLLAETRHLLNPPPPETDEKMWQYTLWRRIAAPLGFLVLALAGLFIAFGIDWKRRSRAVAVAALVFMVYQAVGRLGENLMMSTIVTPRTAALLPVATVSIGALLPDMLSRLLKRIKWSKKMVRRQMRR